MKIHQRTENGKRSELANKDVSSGSTASLKCTIFISKRQENEFATILNRKFMFEWKEIKRKEIYFQHKQEKNLAP